MLELETIPTRKRGAVPRDFVRYVAALALNKGDPAAAYQYGRARWPGTDTEIALKSAVTGGTTTDSNFATTLVYNQNLASQFVEYLRPMTIMGKMSGFRRVPFNVRFATQTGGSTIGWVGEGAASQVSKAQFSSASLGFAKSSGIVVIDSELARLSSPAAEETMARDLAEQTAQFLDTQFIDPGVAAVANVSPASILNGASNVRQAANTWDTAAHVDTDFSALFDTFDTNDIPLDESDTYIILLPQVYRRLAMMRTSSGGEFAFPGLQVGGAAARLYGLPVIASNSVPHSTSAGSIVAVVKASECFLADEGRVGIDVSSQASFQMDSTPTQNSATPTATTVVSMFQTNSIAIRAERYINWSRRRTYSAGYCDNVHTA